MKIKEKLSKKFDTAADWYCDHTELVVGLASIGCLIAGVALERRHLVNAILDGEGVQILLVKR